MSGLDLKEARALFTRLLSQLIVWANEALLGGDELLAFGEGYVALTDGRDGDHDGPHKKGGGHYTGTACDLVLWRGGIYISDGDDRRWRQLGEKWESMNPLCFWGGHIQDSNHFSISYGGRA